MCYPLSDSHTHDARMGGPLPHAWMRLRCLCDSTPLSYACADSDLGHGAGVTLVGCCFDPQPRFGAMRDAVDLLYAALKAGGAGMMYVKGIL